MEAIYDKDWFVIGQQGHHGPYSWDEVEGLYHGRLIDKNSKVWTKTMLDPDPVEKHIGRVFKVKIETPRDSAISIAVPPIPLEALKVKKRPVDKPAIETVSRQSVGWRPYGLLFGLSLALVFCVLFFKVSLLDLPGRPRDLLLKDYERMSKVSARVFSPLAVAPAVGRERDQIYIATNTLAEGKMTLEMRSIEKKVPTLKPIILTAEGELKDRMMTFSSFKIAKNLKFRPGYYRFKIIPKRLELPWYALFLASLSAPQEFSSYIGHKSPANFEKDLNSFLIKQDRREKLQWSELHQRAQTLKAVGEQIQKDLGRLTSFKKLKDLKTQTRLFEQKYQKQYGHFLTKFVIESEAANTPTVLAKQERKTYQAIQKSLPEYARNLGQTAMDILGDFEDLQFLKAGQQGEKFAQIGEKIGQKIGTILENCQEQIQRLEAFSK